MNASNREKDWAHLLRFAPGFASLDLDDRTEEIAMISVQGPAFAPHRRRARRRRAPARARPEQPLRGEARRRGRRSSPGPGTPANRSASSSSCLPPRVAERSGTGSSGLGASPDRPGGTRHPAPGGGPAPLRPRAGHRPRRQADPRLRLPAGTPGGELQRPEGRLRRPGGAGPPVRRLPPGDAPRLRRSPRPAPGHQARSSSSTAAWHGRVPRCTRATAWSGT